MKPLFTLCLVALFPTLALAQATNSLDAPVKLTPFEPIVAADHSGMGRLGVRLSFDKVTGLPQIIGITRGSPAADFGLRVGDVLIKIGKNLTTSLTEDEARLALHGDPGSGVELTIQRDDDPHLVVLAVERRVLTADTEEMIQPPMSEVSTIDPLAIAK